MFDFKKWRIDRQLTQAQAGALLGASSGFWSDMENGKSKAHKASATARALAFYDDKDHWKMICSFVNSLNPQVIADFISEEKVDRTVTIKSLSNACGLSKSVLGNLARGNNDFGTVGTQVKFMICAYMLECHGLSPVAEQVTEEELVSVTIPESAEMPERTFTPSDVVVHVNENNTLKTERRALLENPEFHEVQPVMIEGESWWVLADVCKAIDHSNPASAVKAIEDEDLEKIQLEDSMGRLVSQWVCNDHGLHQFLLRSHTKKSDEFRKYLNKSLVEIVRNHDQKQKNNSFERIEHIMLNGVPMWRLADVCRAIDYKNITEAKNLVRLADLEKSKLANSNGQIVEQWLVNEYGLLRILAKANTPKTEEFERWVFEEVMPAIRKTGSYHAQPQAPTLITALEMQLQAARQLEAQQRQIDAMQAQVHQLAASTVTIEQVATIASAKTVEAHEKHRSDVYYVDKHVKNAAKELTIKVHGRMTAENGDIWKAHRVSKIKELNKSIREAVAKNYACHPKQAPGRDRYSNADKRTAYEALNRWRELNGLQMQLALSLEA